MEPTTTTAAAAATGPSLLLERRDALRAQLERTGAWAKLRARVRAEVVLCNGGGGGVGGGVGAAEGEPTPTTATDPDTFLINELVREYCMYHGLRDTLSVFLQESGQPMMRPFGRERLEAEAGAPSSSTSSAASARLPLLYSLLGRARKAGGLQ